MDLKDFIICIFLIILILIILIAVLKVIFNAPNNIIASLTVVTGILLGIMLVEYTIITKNKDEKFVGGKDVYENYYTKGMFTLGKEKYPKVGSHKDYDLYKEYLKAEFNTPKMYEYPDPNKFETTYRTDLRNRDTVREQKITRYDRHKQLDNLLEEAFAKETNDYYNFWYNEY